MGQMSGMRGKLVLIYNVGSRWTWTPRMLLMVLEIVAKICGWLCFQQLE
jgi:hypothetical protein